MSEKLKVRKFLASLMVSVFAFTLVGGNTTLVKAEELIKTSSENVKQGTVYLSDREPTGYTSYKYIKDKDMAGNTISLLQNGVEKTYEKGISTHAYSSLFYTDLKESGYERFEAVVGISYSARKSNLKDPKSGKVIFKAYLDGKEVFNSGVVTSETDGIPVSIDLTEGQVLNLVVDTNGENYSDHAVWADAKFITESENAPWLEVSDLEFNLAEQVTDSNILEYAEAKDYKGTDISSEITYTTDYVEGQAGNFTVTYEVFDEEGNYRERTVNMLVTNEDYSGELPIERLKKPWASYLYHGRGTLGVQGQKAWDVILKEVLDFDATKWNKVIHWDTEVYEMKFPLQEMGIYVKANEISSIQSMFMDDEPRSFILPDWGANISSKNGLADVVTIYARVSLADAQDEWLQTIETNTLSMLSESKADMNEAQRVYYVLQKFSKWIKYEDGQLLHEALGTGKSVCGGNARATVYLTQRLGVKSIFGRSSVHAWTYSKLSNNDAWYKNDLLAGPAILVDANTSKGNLTYGGNWLNRQYKWFEFEKVDYPRYKLNYPSVWISLDREEVNVYKNEAYDLKDFISNFGSIYNEGITKDAITVEINKLDENGNIIEGNVIGLEESGDGTKLRAGDYIVTYTLEDSGRVGQSQLRVHVPFGARERVYFEDAIEVSRFSKANTVGLFNGTEEVWYTDALSVNDNGSISFDVDGKDISYIFLDYGIKNSVRENKDYGVYGKVQLQILADDVVIYESKVLGWKDKYETIEINIPEGTKKITFVNVPKGGGNNHAAIGNLSMATDKLVVESEKLNFDKKIESTGNVSKANNVGLFNGREEVWYSDALAIHESGTVSFDVEDKGVTYISLDYGIKDTVRKNTAYGFYGKVQVQILADDIVIYEGSVLGWKDKYESINLELPEGTRKVTLKNIPKGAGNNHAAIGNLTISHYNY